MMEAIHLTLTVKPGVNYYNERLENVLNAIQHILEKASTDFLMVSTVFKKYNQFAEPAMSGEDAGRVSLSIIDLQYMDILTQKFDHITRLTRSILEVDANDGGVLPAEVDHAGFIFKLNHMQATVAADEFLLNVSDLKKNLHQLHDHIVEVTQLNFHESDYFRHLDEISEKLQYIKRTLHEIQTERYHESPISVFHIEGEMKKIRDLYTMTSERFVLHWLLKYPEATVEELLQQYKEDGYEQVEEEIELF